MQLEHTSKTRKYETKFLLAAFLTAIALRLIPELMAYPYYALLPSDTNFSFTTLFHDYIGQFGPVTMQSNSISTQQSKDLLLAIDWINHYTPLGSNIIINKNLRGWMELELKDRHFQFDGNMTIPRQQENNYLIKINDEILFSNNNAKLQNVYRNDYFFIDKIILPSLKN